jgi:hypothetical protein
MVGIGSGWIAAGSGRQSGCVRYDPAHFRATQPRLINAEFMRTKCALAGMDSQIAFEENDIGDLLTHRDEIDCFCHITPRDRRRTGTLRTHMPTGYLFYKIFTINFFIN